MAKERKLKCVYCGEYGLKSEMDCYEKVSKGKTVRKYVHLSCKDDYEKKLDFLKNEKEEKIKLYNTIMRVHNIKLIPRQFYPNIEDIRNGSIMFGKIIKKYKEGVPYSIIDETYKQYEDEIIKAIKWKDEQVGFKDILAELRYGLGVVRSKIDMVIRKKKQDEKIKQHNLLKAQYSYVDHIDYNEDLTYKPKENPNDITQFLD